MASPTFASSSTAASPTSDNSYHVFISHRGVDVKKTFASHLYRGLLSHGLRTFFDKQELQVGESLTCQIKNAIRSASVHVAIISPGYSESKWCLQELLLMLESRAPIIPVFYHVKPTDLFWTRAEGVYGKALHLLENKETDSSHKPLRYSSTTIENWTNTLSRVTEISGLDLEAACNGDEGELVEKIVKHVFKKLKKPGLHVAKYPTGLNEKLDDFENRVLRKHQSEKTLVAGIVGMGGAGKTTLAKELFNRRCSNYSKSYFLNDVRESKRSLHSLQIKLLKGLTQMDLAIESVDAGIEMLKEHLLSSCQSQLIVLDDVDGVDQVDALLPDQTVLCSGSLVVITSRNKDVLTSAGVQDSSIYHLTGLNPRHSRHLFCLHAFSQPHPLPGFEYMVDMFLKACDGLPLSLKVFGSLLYGKNDLSYWQDQLDRLQQLPGEIQERLRISYEALNKEEKKIFLDIACFFIGENRDMVTRIWDGSGWKGLLGFRNLQNRSLVEVDTENNIRMHDHLRDLGRDIAEDSGSQLCLWSPTENIDDLLQEASVIAGVRGIRMCPSEYNDDADLIFPSEYGDNDDQYPSFCNERRLQPVNTRKLQLVDIEDYLLERILRRVQSPNLIWLRWKECPCSSLPPWVPMKNLRVLEVDGNSLETLWESESQAPLQLRELMITGPLSTFPKSMAKLKHLQRIYVYLTNEDNVRAFPEEFCNLQSLRALELLRCSKIKSLPYSFGRLTNLQHINLSGCRNLESLPNSFGNLIRLKYLDLADCINLVISSKTLGNIAALEYINLRYCEKIEALPPQITNQRCLIKLRLKGTQLKELPSAIGDLIDLEVLELGSSLLETLPPSLGELRNLNQLTLLGCRELKCLPDSILLLDQLTGLTIAGCVKLCELPFKQVVERETLRESSSIDQCMLGLRHLKLYNTGGISEVSFDAGVCPNLQSLSICSCHDVVEVGTVPNTLLRVELTDCFNLRKLKGLCGLSKLQTLHITRCIEVELPSIETLISLEKFVANGCLKLKSIQGLEQLTKLRKLECSGLEELPGVEHLRSLQELWTYKCMQPKSRRWLEQLTQLRTLHVNMCLDLEELAFVKNLRSLEKLEAPLCKKLKTIRGLEQLTKLRQLSVVQCSELEELQGVEHCMPLEILYANGCPKLRWGRGVVEQLRERLERFVI